MLVDLRSNSLNEAINANQKTHPPGGIREQQTKTSPIRDRKKQTIHHHLPYTVQAFW
jgi:hypothetical protein